MIGFSYSRQRTRQAEKEASTSVERVGYFGAQLINSSVELLYLGAGWPRTPAAEPRFPPFP